MGHVVLKSPSSAVADAGLLFRPADCQQWAGHLRRQTARAVVIAFGLRGAGGQFVPR